MRLLALRSLGWVCSLSLWLACGPSQPQAPADPPDTLLSPQEAAIAREFACLSDPDHICQTGLSFLQVGDPVGQALPPELAAVEVGASWSEGEGFEWLVRVVNLPAGRLVVEGNFLDQRFVNDSIRARSIINRLRIESPVFQTLEGLRVGSSLADLISAFPDRDLGFTPLPSYGLMDVQPDTSHIHFLVPLPDSLPGDSLTPQDLDPRLPITAIVVM